MDHFTDITIGDTIEIKRTITVKEINNDERQIKIGWKDKFGNYKEQWVTYNMFLSL